MPTGPVVPDTAPRAVHGRATRERSIGPLSPLSPVGGSFSSFSGILFQTCSYTALETHTPSGSAMA
jgi:hypothetical protein